MKISKFVPKFLFKKYARRKKYILARKKFSSLGKEVINGFFKNYDWALPLDLLQIIETINKNYKPKLVVELGSGVSTLAWIKNLSPFSTLISIDENVGYLNATAKQLSNKKNVIFLCPYSEKLLNYNFLNTFLGQNVHIDAMLIDGPTGDRFTEPAMDFYKRVLSGKSFCLIDDTDRPETDRHATNLAKALGLKKVDYNDSIRPQQKFSVLQPLNVNLE